VVVVILIVQVQALIEELVIVLQLLLHKDKTEEIQVQVLLGHQVEVVLVVVELQVHQVQVELVVL
tara:strand:+ start:167 stop:361 length:195 start_codon:yes stop_codon:yes gene_type:complete